jgi:putative transposase
VQTNAVALALGVTRDGEQALLGVWRRESAGAPCWLAGFTARHNRGVTACFLAGVDGLQGRPEASEAVLPKPQVPLGMVQKVRHSLKYGPWKERRAGAAALRAISGAAPRPDAEHALARFAERWEAKDPALSPSWLAAWDRLTGRFDYPPARRRAISTPHARESWHDALRKVLQGRGAFPNDEAIVKVLYMGLQPVAQKWTQPMLEWKAALNQFVIRAVPQ